MRGGLVFVLGWLLVLLLIEWLLVRVDDGRGTNGAHTGAHRRGRGSSGTASKDAEWIGARGSRGGNERTGTHGGRHGGERGRSPRIVGDLRHLLLRRCRLLGRGGTSLAVLRRRGAVRGRSGGGQSRAERIYRGPSWWGSGRRGERIRRHWWRLLHRL